jgi:beta-N-acetylhexosaminidase
MNFSQLLIIGLPADNSLNAVRELQPGGIILMGRNARPAPELRRLGRAINEQLEIPAWISTDHEGGRVQRLREGLTHFPSAREVGQGGAQAVSLNAMNVAAELRTAGVNLNFAPVCDVPIHPDDSVIGDRAFGTDPMRAGLLAAEYVRGAQGSIMCCAKHFPGHGGVGVDSHAGLPTFSGSREELEFHLAPFRAAQAAGVGAMMIGHISVPALDASGAPASLSHPIVTGLLREELGFRGLVVTDDLEMGALDQTQSGENAVRALVAGCDVVMFCHETEKAVAALQAVERAVDEGRLSEERVADAIRRVDWAKRRFGVIKA